MSAKRLAEPQKPGQNQLQGSARLFFKLTPDSDVGFDIFDEIRLSLLELWQLPVLQV